MGKDLRNGILGTITSAVAVLSFAGALVIAIRGELAPVALLACLAALLAMPFAVIGLCTTQRPGIATIGQAGAIAFASSCLLVAFVVLYALVAGIEEMPRLRAELGSAAWAAQAAMVPGGVAFGAASYARGMFPRWACGAFVVGLLLVIPTLGTPAGFQLVVLGLVDLGLLGMGLTLLPVPPPPRHASNLPARSERPPRRLRRRSRPRSVAPGV